MTRRVTESVVRPVRRALVSARALVAAEALFLAAAGLGLILAAAAVSGAPPSSGPGPWAAAVLGGAAAGIAWWRANRVAEGALVRTLDRELHQSGALLTAWEVERAGAPTAVGALLVARVARGLSPARLVRAGVPVRAFAPAAPFLAVALLVLALEDPRRADAEQAARLSGGAARHLAQARDLALRAVGEGQLDEERAGELLRLAGRAAELERALAAGGEDLPALEAELAAQDAALERLTAELAADPELAEALARELAEARAFADAARAALGPKRDPERSQDRGADQAGPLGVGPERGDGPGPGRDAAAGAESSRVPDGSQGRQQPSALALGDPDGTMSGPEPSSSSGPPVPRAGLAVRSWPREYDAVVEAWLRAGRTGPAAAGEPR